MKDLLLFFFKGNQSPVVIKASTTSGSKAARVSSITLPPTLNADSDATVVAGIARISRAILLRIGNFGLFAFHQPSMSKSSFLGNTGSSKYDCNSDFWLARIVEEHDC